MISIQLSSLRSRLILTLLITFIPALWLFWQSAQEIRTFATASGEREALVKAADTAMYDAKRVKNSYRFFS